MAIPIKSKGFYRLVAIVSTLMIAIIYAFTNIIKEGYESDDFFNGFFWGLTFSSLMWVGHLVFYPYLEKYVFPNIANWKKWIIRAILVVAWGMVIVEIKAKLKLFPGNIFNGAASLVVYNFRGLITNTLLFLVVLLIETLRTTQKVLMENERLMRENLVAQFETLKQQINPHFLFNALNILKAMIKNHDVHAEEYVLKLSDLYRNLLQKDIAEVVAVEQELSILDNYLYMIKARFEDKIKVEIELDEKARQSLIPPFAIQMLIENCIKHNIISKDNPLWVRIDSEDDFISITNKLQPKRSFESSSRVGLENIARRYEMLMNRKIEIIRSDSIFCVKLPMIYKPREQ